MEPTNFLEKALIERTRQGQVRWDMLLTIGEPGDPQNDPTILWPKEHKELKAGTLTLSRAWERDYDTGEPTAGAVATGAWAGGVFAPVCRF